MGDGERSLLRFGRLVQAEGAGRERRPRGTKQAGRRAAAAASATRSPPPRGRKPTTLMSIVTCPELIVPLEQVPHGPLATSVRGALPARARLVPPSAGRRLPLDPQRLDKKRGQSRDSRKHRNIAKLFLVVGYFHSRTSSWVCFADRRTQPSWRQTLRSTAFRPSQSKAQPCATSLAASV